MDIKKIINNVMNEKPEKADAAIWLQGDRYDRARKVLNLFKKGFANKIVLTGNNDLVGVRSAPGTDNISLIEMEDWLIKKEVKKKDIIIDSNSFNTWDQAENVIKLAKQLKWKKIILVASLYHQPRALLSFTKSARQFEWPGKIVNQPAKLNLNACPGGRTVTAEELLTEEAKKIKKYKIIDGFKT